jgi:hypothetical protein
MKRLKVISAALATLAVALLAAQPVAAAPARTERAPDARAAQAAGPRYRIINFATGKCLDGNSGSGGGVYMWNCVNAGNQYWYFDFIDGTLAFIRNHKTGLCLRVQGGVHGRATVINGSCSVDWDAHWSGINRRTFPNDSRHWYQLSPRYLMNRYCLESINSGTNGTGTFIEICSPQILPSYWTWQAA